jgi:hypothetical protein
MSPDCRMVRIGWHPVKTPPRRAAVAEAGTDAHPERAAWGRGFALCEPAERTTPCEDPRLAEVLVDWLGRNVA